MIPEIGSVLLCLALGLAVLLSFYPLWGWHAMMHA